MSEHDINHKKKISFVSFFKTENYKIINELYRHSDFQRCILLTEITLKRIVQNIVKIHDQIAGGYIFRQKENLLRPGLM